MKGHPHLSRLPTILGGCLAAIAIGACSSMTPTPQDRNESALPSSVLLEEIVPTARRASRSSAVSDAGAEPAAAVPSEELWIIATPGAQGTAAEANGDASPGSGAMLASFLPENGDGSGETREVPLPLKHTDVRARIAGYVGTVDVTQQFENPFERTIEAVYVFPLPEKAAVSEFVMTVGDRRIRGILRERGEAEAIYRQAQEQGYRASLLTQHRPNVFEQKVANIEPRRRIDVSIRYFHTLAYRDGWYSFVFPTVVGPRYNPPGWPDPVRALPRTADRPVDVQGSADGGQPAAAGTEVRYLRPDERSGHDIAIRVQLDAGVRIEAIEASHDIEQARTGAETARIALADRAAIPNRDFVLDFKVAGGTIRSNLLTYPDPQQPGRGYFTMMLYPPEDLEGLRRHPLELVFVLDGSGSMSGQPIAQAKAAVIRALDLLRRGDTFQIIRFSDDASRFGDAPVDATHENIERARQYVRSLEGTGGTEMIEGIRAALGFAHDPRRLRFVTFLTDGHIGNAAEILREIHASVGASRIFSFGVGSSPNRYLLERMAVAGRGAVAWLGPHDAGGEVMGDFFARISRPALADLDIDWGAMQVSDVYPSRLPDLFVGRAVTVTGKYRGEPGDLRVRGTAGAERIGFTLRPDGGSGPEFLPQIWARLHIADLMDRRARGVEPARLESLIRGTALEYGLMSDYTAFVAVDASQPVPGAFSLTVAQPVPVPAGVRYGTTVP